MARYPGATWRPTGKHGYGTDDQHLRQGLVVHSAEGSLVGLFSVLDGSREASWHFSVAKDGHAFQHVDTENIAWTNGSKESNKRFWGIECEGVAGEALTEPQYQALLGVVKWLWATHNPGLPKRGFTLFEHNEMTRYGSASTSCPSGRIPWERLIADLEEDMTPEEVQAMITASLRAWIGPRDQRVARIDSQLHEHFKDTAAHSGSDEHTHEATVTLK